MILENMIIENKGESQMIWRHGLSNSVVIIWSGLNGEILLLSLLFIYLFIYVLAYPSQA